MKAYFKLTKAIEEDPQLNKKAAKAIGKYVSLHPTTWPKRPKSSSEHFRKHRIKK